MFAISAAPHTVTDADKRLFEPIDYKKAANGHKSDLDTKRIA